MRLVQGDCIDVLKTLPDGIVQTVVTSPPYYGLRDYGTAKWDGGDPECDHEPAATQGKTGQRADRTFTASQPFKMICGKCGAVRVDAQIGLEPTPEAYVAKLVAVFAEVRRVLRDDGTLWVVIGDSYAANRGYQVPDNKWTDVGNNQGMNAADIGLKPKDLIGIPWMLAFALRADGWYLRQDIIWAKPNPMPESVTDRCTKSHEYIFLLSKSARYYMDMDAIAEQGVSSEYDIEQRKAGRMAGSRYLIDGVGQKEVGASLGVGSTTRNKRSVWTVTTKAYSGAHFATFPPDLIEPCVLAGSKPGDIVLDPFNGSGTTGAVALKYQRDYIGIELNPKYITLTERRLRKVQIMLVLP